MRIGKRSPTAISRPRSRPTGPSACRTCRPASTTRPITGNGRSSATRIAAALPLDPASAQAQAFYDEWQALLAPFKAVATPEMMAGATELYSRMDEWQGDQQPPFSMEVWQFIQAAGKARAG